MTPPILQPLFPPLWLIRVAVSAVWLYEGLWCKLLGREPRQQQVIGAVPFLGAGAGPSLKALGFLETALAGWALSGLAPIACATIQTLLLIALNTGGILWARRLIHDPAGMVIKNSAFLVLAWVSAGLSAS